MISVNRLMYALRCGSGLRHVLAFVIGMSMAMQAFGQREAAEHEIKAAFIFNFAAYVEWPTDAFNEPQDPVVFGFLEADTLADYLESSATGRLINGRPVIVRRLRPEDNIDGIHILFAGEVSEEEDRARLREAVNQSILTVTDNMSLRPAESIINFETVDGYVRFDVSLRAASAAGLDISSRLLQLAIRVELLQRRRECPFSCQLGIPSYLLAQAETRMGRGSDIAFGRQPVGRLG